MTIQQFQQLDEMDKIAAIMQYGCLLDQSLKKYSREFLYRFESFYVLIRYNIKNDALKAINSFRQITRRMPYYHKRGASKHPAERIL